SPLADLLKQRLSRCEANGLPTCYSYAINDSNCKHVYILACLWSLCNADQMERLNTTASSVQSYKVVSTLIEIAISWGFNQTSHDEQPGSWIKFFINKYLKDIYAAFVSLIANGPAAIPPATRKHSNFPPIAEEWLLNPNYSPLLNNESTQTLAYDHFLNLLTTNAIDTSKSMHALLQLLSSPTTLPLTHQLCGRFLSSLILNPKGVESLLTTFLAHLDQDSHSAGLDLGHALSRIAKILCTIPKQCASPQEYFSVVGPQLAEMIAARDRESVVFQAALYVATQLVNRGPKFGKRFIVDRMLAPLAAFYSSSGEGADTPVGCDLDGNEIIISERDATTVFENLSRLLSYSEPSYALMDSMQSAFLPLYKVYEFACETPLLSKEMRVEEMLESLLRMNSVAKTQLLLSQMVIYRGVSRSGNVPLAKMGAGGGVMFVRLREAGDFNAIRNPDAFVEFLVSLKNDDLTCGVFLDLLEEYIKASSRAESDDSELGNLTLVQILMTLIERFGANLVKGTRRVVDLVKSILVNSDTKDSGSLLLCLTILKTLLNGLDEPNVNVRELFELNDLLIVLQTLESHEEKGIQTAAKDVRRLILIKSEPVSADSSAESDKHASEVLFAKSMLELSDELLPIRAHGMDQIRKMVLGRDPVAFQNLTTVLCSFLDMIQDVDSFIYLHAVSGLSALTDVYPHESLREIVSRYSNAEFDMDSRLRIGEVAAKTIQRAGQVFPKYAPEILPPILRVLLDPHKELRGSAISLLGVVAETTPLPLLPFIQQIMDYIENTLILETKDTVMRQGAVLAMLTLIRGMDGMLEQFPDGMVKRMGTRLQIVHDLDTDELTRYNAGIALEELKDRAEPAGTLAASLIELTTLECIPPEIGKQILLHIPIGPDLLALGLASKFLFAPLIFGSTVPFARLHFKRHLAISNLDIWNHLDSAGIKNEGWLALPFAYQTAIYGQILQAEEWDQINVIQFKDDKSNNLMWSLRWNLPLPQTLRLVQELMANGFDITCQQHRALRWALRPGYKELVQLLLPFMLEKPSDYDFHVFTNAATFGHVEIVEWLLTTGLDPSAADNRALRAAAQGGQLGVANLLLQDPRVDPADADNLAIRVASQHGRLGIVERLLQDERVDPSGGDNNAIQVATQNGHAGVVERLLQDERVDPGVNNNVLIRVACEIGHLEVVKLLLLDSRVNPAVSSDTPIQLACKFGRLEVVRLLLADPRVSVATSANNCIRLAAQDNHVDVLKLLLQDERTDPSDFSNQAIQLAAQNGHIESFDLLLADSRVDPSAADNAPIRFASHNGHFEIVQKLLMDPRVDPSAFNNNALTVANEGGHSNVAQLLESDARVARLVFARNPLLAVTEMTKKIDSYSSEEFEIVVAAENGDLGAVEALLAAGVVDPSVQNNAALIQACKNGHTEVVKVLTADARVHPGALDNQALAAAVLNNHVETVQLLLSDRRVDPSARCMFRASVLPESTTPLVTVTIRVLEDAIANHPSLGFNTATQSACRTGHVGIVHALLQDPRVNPSAADNVCIQHACERGHLEVVQLLLSDSRVDPTAALNLPVQLACEHGHEDVVAVLLADTRVDPSANYNFAVQVASEKGFEGIVRRLLDDARAALNGHVGVVKMLLEDRRVDAGAVGNQALAVAKKNQHSEIVEVLSTRILEMARAGKEEE
ncbi:transmembrane and coiled-coil domains-containing protein 7, partial [Podochytrium sp. JEL0797]